MPKSVRRKSKKRQEPDNILEINEHRLEVEWCEQPLLYHKYASQLAEARSLIDEAKAEMDVVSAEWDSEIRMNPERYGLEKVTEGAIKNEILQQGSHQIAVEKYNAAQKTARMLEAMVKALDQRRSALKCMVELRLANYYADPGTRQESELEEEARTAAIRSRGRRKRPDLDS